MIDEPLSESPFPASGASATVGSAAAGMADEAHGRVQRVAQKAHEAVDRVEQALGSGSERVMDWQQAWSESARDQVRASPLASVGIAFAAGIVFSKLFMR